MKAQQTNLLGTADIGKLMTKFAIPSIIAMLVSSIYNIVDQLFIGNTIGTLGNAATNIAFPVNTLCIAVALLFGIGGASGFNLSMGANETKEAPYYIGNAFTMLLTCGIVIFLGIEIFLEPVLLACGSPVEVLPYAKEYVSITAIGFPFLIITGGGGHLIRADGSPRMTMICNVSGAVINIFLDALFILVLGWGMKGAAFATIIGQIFSGLLVLAYMRKYKTVKLQRCHFVPNLHYIGQIAALGMANGTNQIAMMVVNVVSNNLLKYYGGKSVYGETIPIACAGIVAKVTMLYFSIIIGLAQGAQPIESFNYGAKRYDRVKRTYFLAVSIAEMVSVIAYLCFQFFPRQILAVFGNGTEEYYQFGTRYLRIFLFFAFLNGVQPISSNFFSAIGKAYKGTFLALTRQIIFLLPMILILPRFFGIDGILYAGMAGDGMAFLVTLAFVVRELRDINRKIKKQEKVLDNEILRERNYSDKE